MFFFLFKSRLKLRLLKTKISQPLILMLIYDTWDFRFLTSSRRFLHIRKYLCRTNNVISMQMDQVMWKVIWDNSWRSIISQKSLKNCWKKNNRFLISNFTKINAFDTTHKIKWFNFVVNRLRKLLFFLQCSSEIMF